MHALWLSTVDGSAGAGRIQVNHKRVYRLYREEGGFEYGADQVEWSGNQAGGESSEQKVVHGFVSNCVSSGSVIRMLTIVDDYTRECLAIEVDTSLGGLRVRRVLDRIVHERRLPEGIVLDNEPEFRGRALAA